MVIVFYALLCPGIENPDGYGVLSFYQKRPIQGVFPFSVLSETGNGFTERRFKSRSADCLNQDRLYACSL